MAEPTGSGARVACLLTFAEHDDAAARTALTAAGFTVAEATTGAPVRVFVGSPAQLRDLGGRDATVPLIVLVGEPDRRSAAAYLAAGAEGLAALDGPPEQLAAAIGAVVAGFVVVPAAVRQVLRRPVFTARQKQVLGLLVLGLGNAEIAERLFLSEATVKAHLTTIFTLLDVRSRKDAIDTVLDPASGLGTGILVIAEPGQTQQGYGAPTIS